LTTQAFVVVVTDFLTDTMRAYCQSGSAARRLPQTSNHPKISTKTLNTKTLNNDRFILLSVYKGMRPAR
jgi:hypothetical protein